MPSKVDLRHKIVGSRHRAVSRYAMIRNRLRAETQKNACYAGVELRIDREEFIAWFMANDFDGCSVDRIDPSKHYEEDNLQLIPRGVNSGKDKIISRSGLSQCFRCDQIKKQTEFVKCSRRSTGYTTICKRCEVERTMIRYRKRTGS